MTLPVADRIEALHSPSRGRHDWGYPVCAGCDAEGWEADSPRWPCRTAEILWPDPDEQAALLADWHEWADARAVEVQAEHRSSGLLTTADLWGTLVARSLRPLLFDNQP